jgi:hypothetical protein
MGGSLPPSLLSLTPFVAVGHPAQARCLYAALVVAVDLLQLIGRMLKIALGYADLPPVIGYHMYIIPSYVISATM